MTDCKLEALVRCVTGTSDWDWTCVTEISLLLPLTGNSQKKISVTKREKKEVSQNRENHISATKNECGNGPEGVLIYVGGKRIQQ